MRSYGRSSWHSGTTCTIWPSESNIGASVYDNIALDIEAVEFETAVARLVRSREQLEGFRTRAKAVTGVHKGWREGDNNHRGKGMNIYRLTLGLSRNCLFATAQPVHGLIVYANHDA